MNTDPKNECQLDRSGASLPLSHCPACGKELDAATAPRRDKTRPSPGDLSVCFGCAEILVFDEQMKLRAASLNDLMRLDGHLQEELGKVQNCIRQFNSRER